MDICRKQSLFFLSSVRDCIKCLYGTASSLQRQLPRPCCAVGTGWGMACGPGFPPFCCQMGVERKMLLTSSGRGLLRSVSPRGSQGRVVLTLMPSSPSEGPRAHGGVNMQQVSTVGHQTIHKLHGLSPLTSALPRRHNLKVRGPSLHNELRYSIVEPSQALLGVCNRDAAWHMDPRSHLSA